MTKRRTNVRTKYDDSLSLLSVFTADSPHTKKIFKGSFLSNAPRRMPAKKQVRCFMFSDQFSLENTPDEANQLRIKTHTMAINYERNKA